MTPEELAEAQALVDAATPGPWRHEQGWNNGGCPTDDFYIPGHNSGATVEMLRGDATFIAAAPTLVRNLLAHIAAREERLARLETERDEHAEREIKMAAKLGIALGEVGTLQLEVERLKVDVRALTLQVSGLHERAQRHIDELTSELELARGVIAAGQKASAGIVERTEAETAGRIAAWLEQNGEHIPNGSMLEEASDQIRAGAWKTTP